MREGLTGASAPSSSLLNIAEQALPQPSRQCLRTSIVHRRSPHSRSSHPESASQPGCLRVAPERPPAPLPLPQEPRGNRHPPVLRESAQALPIHSLRHRLSSTCPIP